MESYEDALQMAVTNLRSMERLDFLLSEGHLTNPAEIRTFVLGMCARQDVLIVELKEQGYDK